jgi:hypothetical protein
MAQRGSMNAAPRTYQALQREIKKQAVRDAFVRGPGGRLLFLWTVGVSLFWLGELLVEASIWTAVCLSMCALAVASYLRTPRAFSAATRSLLHARYPTDRLDEPGHRAALHKAIEVCVEVLVKMRTIRQTSRADGDEAEATAQVEGLLALLYESARQAEEFHRILGLVGSTSEVLTWPRELARPGPRSDAPDCTALYQENVRAIQREAGEAEELVRVVADQLETLLLQMLQMERRSVDAVTTIETRRLSRSALERLQQTVDARLVATSWLRDGLATGGRGAQRPDDRALGRVSGDGGADQPSRARRVRADEEPYSEEG